MHVCFEAHRGALRGSKRYVGDIIGVVAADEWEKGNDDIGGEDDPDGEYGPCTEGHCFYDSVDGSTGDMLGPAGRAALRAILTLHIPPASLSRSCFGHIPREIAGQS